MPENKKIDELLAQLNELECCVTIVRAMEAMVSSNNLIDNELRQDVATLRMLYEIINDLKRIDSFS